MITMAELLNITEKRKEEIEKILETKRNSEDEMPIKSIPEDEQFTRQEVYYLGFNLGINLCREKYEKEKLN